MMLSLPANRGYFFLEKEQTYSDFTKSEQSLSERISEKCVPGEKRILAWHYLDRSVRTKVFHF